MKGNRTLWSIWLVALLPLLAALLSYSLDVNLGQGSSNRGELQQPVRTLPQWGGLPARYTGHWTVMLSAPRNCETPAQSSIPERCCQAECEVQLNKLHAVHDALGRDAGRVRVVVEGTDLVVLEPGVWVVDPLGNLLLYYPLEQPGTDLLEDLRRLLKVSSLG